MGIVMNSRSIRHLARLVEKELNVTGDILTNLTKEVQAVRMVALQNRLVLGTMLAEVGGACKIIGMSCCTFTPDYSPDIFKGIDEMHKMAAQIHSEFGPEDWTSWFWDLLQSWGWKLLTPLLVIGGLIAACCCCIQCFPLCVSVIGDCCRKMMGALTPKHTNAMVTNEMIKLEEAIEGLQKIDVSDNKSERINEYKSHQMYY